MMEAVRESQEEKSRQLAAFEMKFKVSLDKTLKNFNKTCFKRLTRNSLLLKNRKRLKERRNKHYMTLV